MRHHPVVITGIGLCSAVGTSVPEVIASLQAARSGLKPYECPQAPNLTTRFAGKIEHMPVRDEINAALVERWDRGTLLAAHSASEALHGAQLDWSSLASDRIGLATGASGSGQFHPTSDNPFANSSIDALTAKIVMQHNVPSFQTNELARFFGVHGPLITVSSASAGSGIAIGVATRWLQSGQADIVLAGGGEGLLPLNIIGFDLLGLLDAQQCSPFSRSAGMTMGEGAAFVVLERYDSAIRRGAKILSQLHGFAVTSDAFDAIQFDPSGDGIRRGLEAALRDSELEPSDIDWIKSSGAGGASQDASELAAMQITFGQHQPFVTSPESTFGHTNGAGPAMGLVSCVACQQARILPGTLNFDQERAAQGFDFVPNAPRQQSTHAFVATTAAFGGTNVVLVGGLPRIKPADTQAHSTTLDEVVITGMGLVTPLGCGQREVAAELLGNHCQWQDLSRFGAHPTAVEQAAFVRDFDARKLLSSLRLRGVDQLSQFAAAATKLALQDAGLNSARMNGGLGVVTGISRTSGETLSKLFEALDGPWGTLTVSKALLRKGRFLVASQLANWFGCKGFTATTTDGLGAGLSGLAAARLQLQHSPDLQAVIVVAADEVSPCSIRMWEALGCMAAGANPDWSPYDSNATGLVTGEGAVALILERKKDVLSSGRSPIATIASLTQTFDAPSIDTERVAAWMECDPNGQWLTKAIENALRAADCDPQDIELLLGNGCGVVAYDQRERCALERIWGAQANVQSVNGHVGVLESACGLLAVAAAASHVHQPALTPAVAGHGSGQLDRAADQPGAALVCGSSELGRNTAVVIKPA